MSLSASKRGESGFELSPAASTPSLVKIDSVEGKATSGCFSASVSSDDLEVESAETPNNISGESCVPSPKLDIDFFSNKCDSSTDSTEEVIELSLFGIVGDARGVDDDGVIFFSFCCCEDDVGVSGALRNFRSASSSVPPEADGITEVDLDREEEEVEEVETVAEAEVAEGGNEETAWEASTDPRISC